MHEHPFVRQVVPEEARLFLGQREADLTLLFPGTIYHSCQFQPEVCVLVIPVGFAPVDESDLEVPVLLVELGEYVVEYVACFQYGFVRDVIKAHVRQIVTVHIRYDFRSVNVRSGGKETVHCLRHPSDGEVFI